MERGIDDTGVFRRGGELVWVGTKKVLGGLAVVGAIGAIGVGFLGGVLMTGWNLFTATLMNAGASPPIDLPQINSAPGWSQGVLEFALESNGPVEAMLKALGAFAVAGISEEIARHAVGAD